MQEMDWWKRAVIYEIYPRSFQDSNGDGVGDLAGILWRLDYLVALGIDTVWISPIYPSPMADFGYDVADYCGIDPLFGTMEDFDRLLKEVHARGLKLILDFVPNHTSNQHSWFLESRSSRDNPRRDWYLWRDEPNNWVSNFGGSGWEFDETTNQYYYHSFLKEQPDLNWRNPAVQEAMFEVLRFWLEREVDGFRVDVMWLMIKDDQYRDNPPNPDYRPGSPESHRFLSVYNSNRPEVHAIVARMRAVVDAYAQRVLIGEIYLPVEQLMTYYGVGLNGANLPFNFHLLQCAWNPASVARVITEYEAALPAHAWPNWVMGNHDQPRIASRIGESQARVAAMLLLTLPGTLTIYYGEEIGMANGPIPEEEVRDPAEINEPGIGAGRDPERTPMQWDASPQAAFTTGQPWLPIAKHDAVNVETLEQQTGSLLHLYRALLALRRREPILVSGKMAFVKADKNILWYQRVEGKDCLQILLNLGHEPEQVNVDQGTIALSTNLDHVGEESKAWLDLRPAEAVIIRTSKA